MTKALGEASGNSALPEVKKKTTITNMVLQHLILELSRMTIKYQKIYLTPFLKLKRKICQLGKENVVLGS